MCHFCLREIFWELITAFADSGRLGPDCWAAESAQPAVFCSLRLHPTLFHLSACKPDALVVPFVSLISRRPCASRFSVFFSVSSVRFCCGRCLFFVDANSDSILVLFVVVALKVILLVSDEVLFAHIPVLNPTGFALHLA